MSRQAADSWRRKPSTCWPSDVAAEWALYYNFDHFFFTEADDPAQGVGIFGRFGYGGEPNILEQFYSLGVGGKGSIPQ
jgi:hypothetical protein